MMECVNTGTTAKVATAGAAAVAGAAVTGVAVAGNKKRAAAAGVELWNSIAEADDPTLLDGAVAESIKSRFQGNAEAQAGVKQAYAAYLQVCVAMCAAKCVVKSVGNLTTRIDDFVRCQWGSE
jgi:hypothetical protein